jgi:NAD(P)H-hydrate repair Nnr-like enzyme with NAD(P)H-hydrate dehydratase domain
MLPVLGAGGSGDLLAGFCAALAGRLHTQKNDLSAEDLFTAATVAACLLVEAGRARQTIFSDPLELAAAAAAIAGSAWLSTGR